MYLNCPLFADDLQKKAEEGGNVGIEIIGELVLFYGFTLEKFYNLEISPR